MPVPASSADFLDLVQKSGLVEEKRLAGYTEKLRADNAYPADAKSLAAQMVRDGILTHFQSEQILQGKWRRFNIGKYKVLERLGQGGMGSVYLCEHRLMRRRVAVKVLPTAKASDPSSLERFQREAKVIAALDHPNIVRAYDIDEDEKLHFLVMEHVDGSSLQDIVKKSGPMDFTRAAHYIRQAAYGLQHAHEAAGIVHRDIKPGNILVDRKGIVKILDMGLARFFYDEDDILTKKYDENVLGTADYLAPEQATDSHNVDIRADIYSLGATCYFCLTGRTPFAEGTVAQKLIWHQTRVPKPIRSFRSDVPDDFIAVIDKAMAKDIGQRYQLPVEFAEALAPWTQSPIPAPPLDEMPQLSPAAMGGAAMDSSTIISRGGPPTQDEPPSSRKVWQVPHTPTPLSTPKPVRSPSATPPLPGTAAARPATSSSAAPSSSAAASAPPLAPAGERGRVEVAAPPPTIVKRPAAPVTKPHPSLNGRVRVTSAAKPAVAPAEVDALAVTENTAENDSITTPAVEAKKKVVKAQPAPSLGESLATKPTKFWGLVAAGAVVGLLLLAAFVWVTGHLLGSTPPTTGANAPPVHVGGPNNPTIDQALERVRANGHIILETDIVASGVSIKWPNLTIESAPGQRFNWRCPDNADPKTPLLSVDSAEGFVLRTVNFDGRNKVDALIQLRGKCPGLTLQDLALSHFKSCGIRVTNAEGTDARPILFNRLQITHLEASQSGIRFDLDPTDSRHRPNQRFRISDSNSANGKLKVTASSPAAVANLEPADILTPGN
jgi:serine/threonine protein kinase